MPLINNYALTNEDYTSAFSNEEDDILTLDTYEKLPTANIGPALRDYLLTVPRLKSFFKDNIFYYNRQDNSIRSLPALNFYLLEDGNPAQFGFIEGRLEFQIILAPANKRDKVPDIASRISNHLSLVLNNDQMLDVLREYNPGLVELGLGVKTDYRKAHKLEGKKVDAYIVAGIANFRVNVIEYYESLWDNVDYTGSNILVKTV